MDPESYARLVTIEKLLMIIASDKRYGQLLEDMRREVYEEYEAPLSRMFPSDPGYMEAKAVSDHFSFVADMIKINQDHGLLE